MSIGPTARIAKSLFTPCSPSLAQYRQTDDEHAAHHAGGELLRTGVISSKLTIAALVAGRAITNRVAGLRAENLQNGLIPTPTRAAGDGWHDRRLAADPRPVPGHPPRHDRSAGAKDPAAGLTVAAIEQWDPPQTPSRNTRVILRAARTCAWAAASAMRVLTVLGLATPGPGYVISERVSVPGFGASGEWICDAAGRCVWRGILDEVAE